MNKDSAIAEYMYRAKDAFSWCSTYSRALIGWKLESVDDLLTFFIRFVLMGEYWTRWVGFCTRQADLM